MDTLALEQAILANKFDPSNMQFAALDLMEQATNGKLVPVTATSPLVAIIEHSTISCAVTNNEVNNIYLEINPKHATSEESLARHLDYNELNTIHAIPGSTKFHLLLGVNTLLQNAVVVTSRIKKIVIPRDTILGYRDEIFFGLHHSIEITITDDETIDVIYLQNNNPLLPLSNPVIETQYRNPDDIGGNLDIGKQLLEMVIDVYQFSRTYSNHTLNISTGFKQTFNLTEQYYYARVYSRKNNGWIELNTVFSEFSYSATDATATAVVKLDGNILQIEIPQIYLAREMVKDEVKVVIYTTQGNIESNFNLSTTKDFSVEFRDEDPDTMPFSAPLYGLDTVYVYSDDVLYGGLNTPTLEEMRTRALTNEFNNEPITEDQLKNLLVAKGYNTLHEKNYIADNVYLASSKLDSLNVGGVDVLVGSGNLDLTLTDMSNRHGLWFNNSVLIGTNTTITPDCVFLYDNGIVSLLTTNEYSDLNGLEVDDLVISLNNNRFMTTPFYYLIANKDNAVKITPFNLDTPKLLKRSFVGTNGNSSGLISTSKTEITRVGSTYELILTASTNESFFDASDAAFIPQLTYTDGIGLVYSMNGMFVERLEHGDYVFKFILNTTNNLDKSGKVVIDNLENYLSGKKLNAPLTMEYELTYNLVEGVGDGIDTTYRNKTEPEKLPTKYQTITLETLNLQLGEVVDSIYNYSKSLGGNVVYKTYAEDVLAYHPEDVYDTDELGHIKFTNNPAYVEGNGEPPLLYTKLHSAGDPMLDDQGVHKVGHYKDQLILDSMLKPIAESRDNANILTNVLLVDYKLNLIDPVTKLIYRDNVRDTILKTINDDIMPLESRMLELSELKYTLGKAIGQIAVRFDRDSFGSINTELELEVVVKLSNLNYSDVTYRGIITDTVKSVIVEYLRAGNFVSNELTSLLHDALGTTVVAVALTEIDGRENIISFTMEDTDSTIGVKALAYKDLDGSVKLRDGINIIFKLS